MKPVLAIGLGNLLMGDDGVGVRIAERLMLDPGLPPRTTSTRGGTDLLRFEGEVAGRRRVVVIDAIHDGDPGEVHIVEDGAGLDLSQEHAHALSMPQAAELLRMATGVPVTLVLISIGEVRFGEGLSPVLAAQMEDAQRRILELFA